MSEQLVVVGDDIVEEGRSPEILPPNVPDFEPSEDNNLLEAALEASDVDEETRDSVRHYFSTDETSGQPSLTEVGRPRSAARAAGTAAVSRAAVAPAGPSRGRRSDEFSPSDDLVRVYFNEISRYPLLTAQEEVEIAKRIEAGLLARKKLQWAAEQGADMDPAYARDLGIVARDGEQARQQLLNSNLRLAVSVAKRYTGRGMPFLDLIQEGNLGLIRAVEKFDYTQGFKFSTYATWWIRQAITKGKGDQERTIRLPTHLSEQINKMRRVRRDLLTDLGREPTDDEVAEEMDIDAVRVQELTDYARAPISINMQVNDESDDELGNHIRDDSAPDVQEKIEYDQLHQLVRAAVGSLSAREAAIIRYQFGMYGGPPMSFEAIGQRLGVAGDTASRMARTAMSKLMHPSRSLQLADFARGG